jgi:hypothetical protein
MGFLKLIRANNPKLNGIALVDVSTPDFQGRFRKDGQRRLHAWWKSLIDSSTVRDQDTRDA